jgi:DNA-binding response OmpR family regulator
LIGEHARLRRLIRTILSTLALEVHEATPSQARQCVQGILPNLLVVDVHLPRERFLFLFRQLRPSSSNAELPAVFLLPAGDDYLRLLATSSGASACIEKPFRARLLQDTVRELLNSLSSNGESPKVPRGALARRDWDELIPS